MRSVVLLSVLIIFLQSCYSQSQPILKIGLVADSQYSNKPSKGKRHYRESLWKLEEAIDTFNYYKVDFVQNLGDVIDEKRESFDSILSIYNNLSSGIENHHLIGNHDLSIDSSELDNLLDILSMSDYYYSYVEKGWRFIVIDGTDYSFFSIPLHARDSNEVHPYYNEAAGKPYQKPYSGAVGEEQQAWLKHELNDAKSLGQSVILFSHYPVKPIEDKHNLWNSTEIIELLDGYPNVVAYINGHNHAGGYIRENEKHFITICGMVDTMVSSYAILEIFADRMVLKGFGNQRDIVMNF